MVYSVDHIRRALERKGYKFFESGDFNVNIVGVRNSLTKDKVTNAFDDVMTLSYKKDGEWQYHEFDCTTDPGTHYMNSPIVESKGTAILKPGQYRGSHKIRKHQGRYEALGQCRPVTVYRDNNRDDVYNLNTEKTDTGLYGINIHKATKYAGKNSTQVDKWSAGCQVLASNDHGTQLMKFVRKARATRSNRFPYSIMESKAVPTIWL